MLARRSFVMALTGIVLLFASVAAAQPRAGGIDSISPGKGRKGDTVTIQGHGFGARNVSVTVGGVPAPILQATGFSVTFRLPDGVKPGLTQVVATNPGLQSGGIQFRMLEGILLPGDPNAPVTDATFKLIAQGAGSDQILNTIQLTRIEVRFQSDATVAEVNNLLQHIDGGIVGMLKGSDFLTIAIPQQPSIAAIDALVNVADGFPGVAFGTVAQVPQHDQIFVAADQADSLMQHLLPGRFPAAWNALPPGLTTGGLCPNPVRLLIADDFGATPPGDVPSGVGISAQFFPAPAPPPANFQGEGDHGYYVTLVAAAENVGANPFVPLGCLFLQPVQTAGLDVKTSIDTIVSSIPSGGKFIVNESQTFVSLCQGEVDAQCVPPQDVLTPPLNRAATALYWKEQTRSRWSDFLMVVAAGNDKSSPGALIYPGMGDARYDWFASIAQLPDSLFNFVEDGALWNPAAPFVSDGFTSLLPAPDWFAALQTETRAHGLTGSGSIADNVIVVGSATAQSSSTVLTQHVTGDQLGESVFSDRNPDVLAVGEGVFFPKNLAGTSFAAPQVAGLASYLWMLSPDLESQPASITKQAIVTNTRGRVIDAYASVLSLDAAALPSPENAKVRLALLDVNGDGHFDETDVDIFLRHFFVVAPDGSITRQAQPGTTADFSRYDLNGDGFTTAGARRERFDLDRIGSTQYGQTNYSTVSQTIEGAELHFDETALTDLEVLCYYAYSPMFQGNPDARKSLLLGRCGLSVQPASATVNAGQTQQFTAVAPSNDSVTWSVTPGCGSIDQSTGLFTAGTSAGSCTVTATDNNDASEVGTATVTVSASTGHFGVENQVDLLPGTLAQVSSGTSDHPAFSGTARSGGIIVTGSGPAVSSNPSFNDAGGSFTGSARCTGASNLSELYHAAFYVESVPATGLTLSVSGNISGPLSNQSTATVTISPTSGRQSQPDIAFVPTCTSASCPRVDDNGNPIVYTTPINQTLTLNAPGDFTVRMDLLACSTSVNLNYSIR